MRFFVYSIGNIVINYLKMIKMIYYNDQFLWSFMCKQKLLLIYNGVLIN